METLARIESVYGGQVTVPPLKVARIASGLKQEELAELAGVTRQTIGALEGGSSPRLRTAQALAEALGVPIAELFPAKDERHPAEGAAVKDRADGRDNEQA
jgi:transcriptional regulator with XRE-family HTH domain